MSEKSARLTEIPVDGISLRLLSIPLKTEHDELTESELDVAQRLIRDQSYAEIARVRGTAKSTVATQVSGIFEKLEVSSTSELIVVLAKSS